MSGNGEPRGIRSEAVTAWLVRHVDGVEPPLVYEPILGGHSNLTYTLTDRAGRRYVLRRPPLGGVLATAHDVAREHRIIAAVGRSDVPVAPALGLCEDPSVNGAPFYVMGFVDGAVLHDAEAARQAFPIADERRTLGERIVDVLARLHRLDPDAIGLGDLARKEAYLDRQLKRWRTQWEKSKTRELAAMEESYELLRAAKPEQRYTGIVHGDYRIGNLILTPDRRVAAVLDWELCTLGDTLADIGFVLNDWEQPGEGAPGGGVSRPTASGGFPTREELVARYAETTGREVAHVAYYRGFQAWRLAAIAEGVLARYTKGVMGDSSVATDATRARVDALANQALQLIRAYAG